MRSRSSPHTAAIIEREAIAIAIGLVAVIFATADVILGTGPSNRL
jgi:hypothetical protein